MFLFLFLSRVNKTRFVLEVGCSWTSVEMATIGDSHYMTVLGNTLIFDGDTVTVK